MRDHEHRRGAGTHELDQPLDTGVVQVVVGLVEEHQFRGPDQGRPDAQQAALAAGERTGGACERRPTELHTLGQRAHLLQVGEAASGPESGHRVGVAQRVGQARGLGSRQFTVEAGELRLAGEQHVEQRAGSSEDVLLPQEGDSRRRDGACRRLELPRQQPEERGLAAPVGADERADGAAPQREMDVVDEVIGVVRVPETDADRLRDDRAVGVGWGTGHAQLRTLGTAARPGAARQDRRARGAEARTGERIGTGSSAHAGLL